MAELTLEQAQALVTPLFNAERYAEAEAISRQILSLYPDHAGFRTGLGIILFKQQRRDEAIAEFRRALEIQPNNIDAHYFLGLERLDRRLEDEAIAEFRRTIEIEPRAVLAHSALADALRMRGDYPEAMEAARRALALNPQSPSAHCTLGLIHLLRGEFQQGWPEYEWRFKTPFWKNVVSGPAWTGEPLGNRTLLLYADQGLGDTIQMVRYLPLVLQRGGRVVLCIQDALHRLLGPIVGAAQIVPAGRLPPPAHLQCTLGSLPHVFRTDLNSIPSPGLYIRADPAAIARWTQKWEPSGAALRVGLNWAGNPLFRTDHRRSMTLAHLAPLAQVSGVTFHSLHLGPAGDGASAFGSRLIDHTAELTDFAETAALIANLDLVISVDTAVPHLAAAMGKPTWIMLGSAPDWRWMLGRSDSPWYSSVRLLRQKTFGDWSGVVQQVAGALGELAAHRRQGNRI